MHHVVLLLISPLVASWHVAPALCGRSRQSTIRQNPSRLVARTQARNNDGFGIKASFQQASAVEVVDLNDYTVATLQNRLETQQNNNPSTEIQLVQIEGYVISHRAFSSSFCFLDLSKRNVVTPVQAMLRRQTFSDSKRFDGFMKSLVPGVRICVTGPVAPTRNGEALVLIQKMTIEKLPHNPQHIRKLVKLVSDQYLQAKDLSRAANRSEKELLVSIQEAKGMYQQPNHPKLFDSLAKELLGSLQCEFENDAEYPNLSSDHKYTHSLATAPSEIQNPQIELHHMSHFGATEKKDPKSIQGLLQELCQENTANLHSTKEESVIGWVQNRRRFRESITVLELVDHMDLCNTPEDSLKNDRTENAPASFSRKSLKCILHPKVLQGPNNSNFSLADLYGKLLSPGSQVQVTGCLDFSHNSETSANNISPPAFWIHTTKLLRSSWRPAIVQNIIQEAVQEKRLSYAEAAQALHISQEDMERLASMRDVTQRQWKGAEISKQLQQHSMNLSFRQDPKALSFLNGLESVRLAYPSQLVNVTLARTPKSEFISTPGSRWKRKKEPQLEWMAQQVEQVLQKSFPTMLQNMTNTEQRPLRILDVGGGKGLLANSLASKLLERGWKVEILVLDVSEGVIQNGRLRSKRRNLTDVVQYMVADASAVSLNMQGRFDLVVALHACGGLTDVALGHAVSQRAAFVICPCCFCSNPSLGVPVYNPLNGGEDLDFLSLEEWLGVEKERYHHLKTLAEVQGDIDLANRAIHTICATRLAAVTRNRNVPMEVSIKTFPVAFSTRNYCLVGNLI